MYDVIASVHLGVAKLHVGHIQLHMAYVLRERGGGVGSVGESAIGHGSAARMPPI